MQNNVIQQLKLLAQQAPEVDALWLYGSRARGQAREQSDYDLAVLFKEYINDPLERRLRPETLAISWQQALAGKLGNQVELSVVDIALAPVPLAFTVISDNTLLHTENEFAVMQAERKILSKWELDYQYHVRTYA